MRFMSFRADGVARFGLAIDSGVVDLTARAEGEFAGLKEAIAADAQIGRAHV